MAPRLGYNTNGFGSHRLEDALQVIAGIGYRSVGLTLDAGALDPYAPDLEARTGRVAALAGALDLALVVETGARFLLDPWRKHWPTLLEADAEARGRRRDFLERAVVLAAELGAPVVSLWSGAAPEGADPAELDARLGAELRGLCERAAACGVQLGFEPEPGMYIESMADFERIAAQVAHPAFRLTLDVGHAHLTEDDAVATIRRYADRVVNVHLEGMRRPVHDHLVPWEGDLDARACLQALEEVGYAGPVTLELSRHSHAAVDTARRAYSFLTSS